MMNSINNLMWMFSQFRGNPMQFLMQHRLNIPPQYANDPDGAIQYLMNQGQMSQSQYNQVMQMYRQIKR